MGGYSFSKQVVVQDGVDQATVGSVSSSASTVTLLDLNASRRGAAIYNDSGSVLYVKYGTGATASSFTIKMDPSGYFELGTPIYRGIVTGIWAAADGAARITEV